MNSSADRSVGSRPRTKTSNSRAARRAAVLLAIAGAAAVVLAEPRDNNVSAGTDGAVPVGAGAAGNPGILGDGMNNTPAAGASNAVQGRGGKGSDGNAGNPGGVGGAGGKGKATALGNNIGGVDIQGAAAYANYNTGLTYAQNVAAQRGFAGRGGNGAAANNNAGNGGAGGDGEAISNTPGTTYTKAYSFGGFGGDGGRADGTGTLGTGGNGGKADATAATTSLAIGYSEANAGSGGAGGNAFATSNTAGTTGGDAGAATATTNTQDGQAEAYANKSTSPEFGVGGNGGNGNGAGKNGGPGGKGSNGTANATVAVGGLLPANNNIGATANARGGKGGQGGSCSANNASGGKGGNGGKATSTSSNPNATANNSNHFSIATSTAGTGGEGGAIGATGNRDTGGDGGIAEATATGANTGNGPMTCIATAKGGDAGGRNSSGGDATATSNAESVGLATATSTASGGKKQGTGNAGKGTAKATVKGAVNSTATAKADAKPADVKKVKKAGTTEKAKANSPAVAYGEAALDILVPIRDFVGAYQAAGFSRGEPSEDDVLSVITPNVFGEFSFSGGSDMLCVAAMGGSRPTGPGATSILTQYEMAIELEIDISQLVNPGALKIGFMVADALGAGFNSLQFEIWQNGAVLPGETYNFSSAAAANAFFNDTTHIFGSMTPGPFGTLDLEFHLTLQATNPGDGYSMDFMLGTVDAPCPADLDDGSGAGAPDGGITIDDLLYFLGAFSSGDIRADLDDGSFTGTHDGGVTIDDLLYFLSHFSSGC